MLSLQVGMSKKLYAPVIILLAGLVLLLGNMLLRARDASQVQIRYGGFSWGSNVPCGVAFSGTNYLFAARATNGAISVVRISKDWPVAVQQLDLGHTGGVPRVAFDGSNYLVVWPDMAAPPADLYGQFISIAGAAVGSPFLIETDADASQAGGLAFDGTNYLVVWEAHGAATNSMSSVQGRILNRAGELLGGRLQISQGGTPQKFPAVACRSNHFLVCWVSRSETTNLWDVLGRRIGGAGEMLESSVISQVPAQGAWPPAVASNGTNWLSVWSREKGPYPIGETNAWVPALMGRLLAADGTFAGAEFEVRRGLFGQINPAAVFDGVNYEIACLDRRLSGGCWTPCFTTTYTACAAQINPTGALVLPAFPLFSTGGTTPPSLALGTGEGREILAWGTSGFSTAGLFLVPLGNEQPVLQNFAISPGGGYQFEATSRAPMWIGIQSSTDLVNWTVVPVEGNVPYNIPCPGPISVSTSTVNGPRLFFRAYNGKAECVANLRLIHQAKGYWALDRYRVNTDTPSVSDLVGSHGYLLDNPVCPHRGTYTFSSVGIFPSCSAAGHTY